MENRHYDAVEIKNIIKQHTVCFTDSELNDFIDLIIDLPFQSKSALAEALKRIAKGTSK